jgi:uncharacterized protein (TIGR04255 family)
MSGSAGGSTNGWPLPLAFVAAEVRTALAPALGADAALAVLRRALPELPVIGRAQRNSVALTSAGPQLNSEQVWRLLDRKSSTSLSVGPTTVALETTHYPGVEAFIDLFGRAVATVAEIDTPAAVSRIGLRYVNEVWGPLSVASAADWAGVISEDVLAGSSAALSALTAAEPVGSESTGETVRTVGFEAAYAAALPDRRAVSVRLQTLFGPGVVGSDPLRRAFTPATPGPFFVIDLDGSWPSEQAEAPEFSAKHAVATLRALHAPIEALFLWATTDDYRKRVLPS